MTQVYKDTDVVFKQTYIHRKTNKEVEVVYLKSEDLKVDLRAFGGGVVVAYGVTKDEAKTLVKGNPVLELRGFSTEENLKRDRFRSALRDALDKIDKIEEE